MAQEPRIELTADGDIFSIYLLEDVCLGVYIHILFKSFHAIYLYSVQTSTIMYLYIIHIYIYVLYIEAATNVSIWNYVYTMVAE